MKITKKVIKEVEVIEDMLCNLCGNSLKVSLFTNKDNPTDDQDEDHLFEFYGLKGIKYQGGYWSEGPIEDMMNYSFNLCEPCLGNLFASFKIPAEQWDRTSMQSRLEIQEEINEIYNEKDPNKLVEKMLDEDRAIRKYSEIRYKQLSKADFK